MGSSGAEYEVKNTNSRFHMQVNPETRRFERLFVFLSNYIDISYGCGIKFVTVDATYRQGFLHMLTTRDGDNKLLVLDLAVCETNSGSTYTWFVEQYTAAGLARAVS